MMYPSAWWHDLWREGLVSGNGFVGANVFGGVKYETVMLTHRALWHHGYESELPDVRDAFQRQRKLMDEGAFREASWEVVNALNDRGYRSELESPFPAGALYIEYTPRASFTSYLRGVNMDSGEIFSYWKEDADQRESTLFVSRADGVVVKRIKSSEGIDVSLRLDAYKNVGSASYEKYGQHIEETKKLSLGAPYMTYTALNDDGELFGIMAKVSCSEGIIENDRDRLIVRRGRGILVLIKVFAEIDKSSSEVFLNETKAALDGLEPDYDMLLKRHVAIHKPLYKSADYRLDYGTSHSNEELLLNAYYGKQDQELIEKLWHWGRYLFISGTDENGDPFPLYGLWGGDYRLMWAHNMANENIQMIYWHTYVGNLVSFQKAFMRYFNQRIPTFRNNAVKLFGMHGLYMTAGTTPGVAAPNQVVPVIINWVSAGAWIAQHYIKYYRYTNDEVYFESEIMPFLMEIAEFYEDFVVIDEGGSIRFYPSVSPENTPGNFMPPKHVHMAHPMPTTINSTIDLAILKEFLISMCELSETHKALKSHVPAWRHILDAIPPYKLTKEGAVREWQDERFEERYDHRHLSHMYPVFPGEEVNQFRHSELLGAFRKAVSLRKIDAQTGWSMAHMASIYARLGDGESAMVCLDKMARSCFTNSFLSLHNDWRGMNISLNMDPAPVQLDAIMGYVNAVQEMILYVSKELICLLPALPEAMSMGKVDNFNYGRGHISLSWDRTADEFSAILSADCAFEAMLKLPPFMKACTIETQGAQVEADGYMHKLKMEKGGTVKICQQRTGEHV